MNLMRAFIAVPLPAALQEQIWKEISPLRSILNPKILRWVAPENIHLTLKFLGDTPEEKLDDLKKILAEEMIKIPSFEMHLRKIGVFPNLSCPRVIWLGVEGSGKLLTVYKSVQAVSRQIGSVPEKRRFSAHLTLGRVKGRGQNKRVSSQIRTRIEESPPYDFGKVRVKSVHLFESKLKTQGAEYRSLFEAKLGDFFE